MAVEHQELAVLGLAERVDLGERQVVAQEDLDQRGDDRRQLVQVVAADAGRRDRLLGDVRRERHERREVGARDVLGMLLGDLLDVDAAHVAEDQDRQLAAAVPGDGGEVLLRDRRALLDQHAARLLAVDLELEDGVGGCLGRRPGSSANLTPPAFMRPPVRTCDLRTTRPADLGWRSVLRLGRGLGDATLQQRGAVARRRGPWPRTRRSA